MTAPDPACRTTTEVHEHRAVDRFASPHSVARVTRELLLGLHEKAAAQGMRLVPGAPVKLRVVDDHSLLLDRRGNEVLVWVTGYAVPVCEESGP